MLRKDIFLKSLFIDTGFHIWNLYKCMCSLMPVTGAFFVSYESKGIFLSLWHLKKKSFSIVFVSGSKFPKTDSDCNCDKHTFLSKTTWLSIFVLPPIDCFKYLIRWHLIFCIQLCSPLYHLSHSKRSLTFPHIKHFLRF